MDKLAVREQEMAGILKDELVPEALALMVETCADYLDTKSLCSLLQVSNACRTAMQGSRGHHSISIKATTSAVAGLKAWRPKWAGLVAGLCLLRPDGWYDMQPSVRQNVIQQLMSAIKRHTMSAASSCADTSNEAARPGTGGADNSSKAASPGMPLLLKRFSTWVDLPPWVDAPPLALDALPIDSLTRLELRGLYWSTLNQLHPAVQQLTNLENLKVSRNYGTDEKGLPGAFCWSLSSLKRLKELEIGPMFASDASSCLPTSLVKLKLEFQTAVRVESEAADSAHGSSADQDEDDWSLGEPELTEEQYNAARLLDLTSLPLLQCCQVVRTYYSSELQDDYADHDYTDLATVRLAAPHLTRLLLIDHFRDVEGLEDCTNLRQLRLQGCAIPVRRLAELVSVLPSLLDFWFCGGESGPSWDVVPMQLEVPILWAPVEEQRQLAVAISGATQLTSLCIYGLSESGYIKVGNEGGMTVNDGDQQSEDSDEPGQDNEQQSEASEQLSDNEYRGQYTGWGEKVRKLGNLQRLVMDVPMPKAEVLQLTQLTALTYICMSASCSCINVDLCNQVMAQMPGLKRFNPGCFNIDIEW